MINIGEFYNHLNEQERKVFYAAMAVLIIALFDGLFLRPVLSRLEELEDQIRSTSRALERDLRFISYRDKILEEDRLFRKYQTDESKIGEEIIAGFLKTIEVIASEKQISLSRVTPADFSARKGSVQYFASVECSGKLTDMIAFIYAIDSTDNLLKIVRMNMSGNKASKDDVKVEMKVAKLVIDPATVGNYAFDAKDIKMPQALLDEAATKAGLPVGQQKNSLEEPRKNGAGGGSGGSTGKGESGKTATGSGGGGGSDGQARDGASGESGGGAAGGISGSEGKLSGSGSGGSSGEGGSEKSGSGSSGGGSVGGRGSSAGNGAGGNSSRSLGGAPGAGAQGSGGSGSSSGAGGSGGVGGRTDGEAVSSGSAGSSIPGGTAGDQEESDFYLGGRDPRRRAGADHDRAQENEVPEDDTALQQTDSGKSAKASSATTRKSDAVPRTELQKDLKTIQQGGRVRVDNLGSLWEKFLSKVMGKEDQEDLQDPGEYYEDEPQVEEKNLWERKFR